MDVIYRNAAVTIIACAGNDSKYGLLGVAAPKRELQAYVSDELDTTVTTLGKPGNLIRRSKWRSRAWTYQEGLFSKRRLIITDRQVYFECGYIYCYESLDLGNLQDDMCDCQTVKELWDSGYFPDGVGTKAWDLFERIQEYSHLSENLTEPADILRGILGILNAFEIGPIQVSHHAGVLLLPASEAVVGGCKMWTPSQSFFSGLC
jgi:hypothetical protein